MPRIAIVYRCAWTLSTFRSGLMRHLVRQGWEVHGIGRGGDGYEGAVEATGAKFHAVPLSVRSLSPLADLKYIFALRTKLREIRPDIVHLHTIKPVIYGGYAARKAGVPRVVSSVTGLGYVFTGAAPSWLRRLVQLQYKWGLKYADSVTFCNSTDKDLFVSEGMAQKKQSHVVLEGVDLTEFLRGAGPQNEGSRVLMVGRLLADKGVREYVEAARIVQSLLPGATFDLLGGRDDNNPTVISEAEVKVWCDLGLINWLGEVPAHEVKDHLARASVVVLPSYREGSPKSLMEAGAMEVPVVATDVPGCRDVVTHEGNGLLVPAKNAEALASAILRLLRDPMLAAKLGKGGRDRAERDFDEQVMIRKLMELYV